MNPPDAAKSDVELLYAARSDAEAFGHLYRRHVVNLERWLRSQTPDPATAADLTAETFAQALVSLKRFHGDSDEAVKGWLFGIARNLLRRYRRRGRAELTACRKLGIEPDHGLEEMARVEQRLDAVSDAERFAGAIEHLPGTQRHAFQLRVVQELDYADAAAQMGISEENARIRVSRAIKAISLRLQGASQ